MEKIFKKMIDETVRTWELAVKLGIVTQAEADRVLGDWKPQPKPKRTYRKKKDKEKDE